MIKGNKAIVTGASRGIGFAIAKELVNAGCSVVITRRNEKTLKVAAEKISKTAIPMVWNASDIDLAADKINEAAEILGGLDIVVNNAGIFAQRNEWSKTGLLLEKLYEVVYIVDTAIGCNNL